MVKVSRPFQKNYYCHPLRIILIHSSEFDSHTIIIISSIPSRLYAGYCLEPHPIVYHPNCTHRSQAYLRILLPTPPHRHPTRLAPTVAETLLRRHPHQTTLPRPIVHQNSQPTRNSQKRGLILHRFHFSGVRRADQKDIYGGERAIGSQPSIGT